LQTYNHRANGAKHRSGRKHGASGTNSGRSAIYTHWFCDTSNVWNYRITQSPRGDCEKEYLGQSKRQFGTQLREHQKAVSTLNKGQLADRIINPHPLPIEDIHFLVPPLLEFPHILSKFLASPVEFPQIFIEF
jgi:hypothetical protein